MERSASAIWAARPAGESAATGGPATVVGVMVVAVVVGTVVVEGAVLDVAGLRRPEPHRSGS